MKNETVYVVTHSTEDDSVVVQATVVFDIALDSAREFPFIKGENNYRYIDVWRSGDIAHTLFFGENGLETARPVEAQLVEQ